VDKEKIVKDLEFLEQFSTVHLLQNSSIESIGKSAHSLIQASLICIEFAKNDLESMNSTLITMTRLISWTKDVKDRSLLLDKMILRIMDILSPICPDALPRVLMQVFKNQIEMSLEFNKKFNDALELLGSNSVIERIQSPVDTLIISIDGMISGFGGFFVEEAMAHLLQQMYHLVKDSKDDALVLVRILKLMQQYHNPTKRMVVLIIVNPEIKVLVHQLMLLSVNQFDVSFYTKRTLCLFRDYDLM
jgi:hypothetical protein